MKKSNKSFIILCIGLLLLIGLVNKIFKKETQNNNTTNIKRTPILIFDEREYYSNWNDNVNEDLISIQKLLIKNNITGCGEFYYNEIEPETFIIACTRDGVNFKYYVAWILLNKIYSAESDMLTIIKSPK